MKEQNQAKEGWRARDVVYWLVMGVLAGFVNGLLGAGGGILIVFALASRLGYGEENSRDLYANALCVMFPISVLSCIRYARAGHLSLEGFGIYALPAVIGGVVGGILLGKVRGSVLKKLFGALVIYSGILLIVR